MKHLIVIGGPTASGKTALAIEVARHYGTEIISADSRQFYRELAIGNARPRPEELAAVPHHFIADRLLQEPLSAGRFAEEAMARLQHLYTSRDVAVAVGGSGLYLRALCEGLDDFPAVSQEARTQVETLYLEEGLPGLQRVLRTTDPDYFRRVDQHNPRRLQRALEVSLTAGRPYSSFLGQRPTRPFRTHYFMPAVDRQVLYRRIEQRVDHMLGEGLEAEALRLYPLRGLRALETVGYQEWWPYFEGSYDRDRAVDLIKRNSRRYAKRQLNWFSDYPRVTGAAAVWLRMDA